MKKYNILLLLSFLLNIHTIMCDNPIKFVCTAALVPGEYESRRQQYIASFELLNKYGCDLYVIESIANGPTFLDDYCKNVCYTHSNVPLKSKSYNEATSLSIGLKQFNFKPGTMIIKLTGKYPLKTDEIIQLVRNNPDADAFVKPYTDYYTFTYLFAIRIEYLMDFLENNINYPQMMYDAKCLEMFFDDYIKKIQGQGAKIVYLPKMYVDF